MKNLLNSFLRRFLFFLLLSSQHLHAGQDFNVVVSIKPLHSIIAGLMKDVGQPQLLISSGDNPYIYQPDVDQQKFLAQSDLVIWVGPELEQSLLPAIKKIPESTRVIEVLNSPGMKILPSRHESGMRDPFFWMDDRNIIILLDELAEILIEEDTPRAHIYARNRREMLKPLRQIDKEYEYGYRGMKAGFGLQYFDTLQYFEQAYALTNLDMVTPSPLHAQDALSLLKVRKRINEGQASCLFTDKSLPAENLALLTAGQNINIGQLDVFGSQFEPGPALYLQLMQYNTDTIKSCLNADMNIAADARGRAVSSTETSIDGIGGRFILTDHLGGTVTEQDMKGRYSLIFFGYTFCPDICPTSLAVLSQAFTEMGDGADQFGAYFVTVDPERDTVEVLRDYVSYFDPRLSGLTGSREMINRVAEQFRVKFEKADIDPANPERYTVDHTASLFLMGPDGGFVTKFAHGISPQELARQLQELIQ